MTANPQKAFTTAYSGHSRVLSNTVIVVQTTTPPRETFDPQGPGCKQYRAIWDTGATGTAISARVVSECSLAPIGVVQVQTGGGSTRANQYLIDIGLPNKVFITSIPVIQLDIQGSDVLIGMDIISNGDFAVTNLNGRTVFSFRTPSLECIDFVQNPYKPKPRLSLPHKRRR